MWPFSRKTEAPKNVSPENPSVPLASPSGWLVDWFVGSSASGQVVSEATALRSSTVYRCVSLISGLVASLPLSVYERRPDGRRAASEQRLYPLLHDAPNDLMGSFIWRELMAVDILLGGNHYSVIERDNANRIIGFMPVPRHAMTPFRQDGTMHYRFQQDAGAAIVFPQSDVIHVPGLGFDGLTGLSVIGASAGRETVGLELALSEHMGRMHNNGARPSGVLEVPPGISLEGFRRLKDQFTAEYSGNGNAGKTFFADQGVKFTPIQMSPQDTQTLETRKFQVSDICRLFGVPPHMVGEVDRTTSWGTGIEQQSIGFLRFTLEPWLKRIEDELARKLFSGSKFYAEFDRDALMAMDSKSRAEMWSSGIQNGYIKPSEARHWLNLPAADGADQLLINSTLVPLAQAGMQPQAPDGGSTPAPAKPDGAKP